MKTENTRFIQLHNQGWRGFRCWDAYAKRCCFHQVFMADHKLLLPWKQFNLSRNAVFTCHKASVHNWISPFRHDKARQRMSWIPSLVNQQAIKAQPDLQDFKIKWMSLAPSEVNVKTKLDFITHSRLVTENLTVILPQYFVVWHI